MNVADFDVNEWERKCKHYDKNRIGLKFDTKFGLEKGILKIGFDKVDKKYVASLKHLATSCAQGAIIYMNHEFSAYYASEKDYEAEYEKNMGILKDNMESFLKVFFYEGFDAFVNTVGSVTTLQRVKYELEHIEYKDGQFLSKTDGTVWNGQFWVTKDKTPVVNCISQTLWETILPMRKTA